MIEFTSEFGKMVKRHIDQEYFVWLTTVDAKLVPQPRPVWYVWDRDAFLIYSEPHAHKVQHLEKHPHVSLHFNTADEKGEQGVIVFLGTAVVDRTSPPAHAHPAYLEKYRAGIGDLDISAETMGQQYSIAIRVVPASVRGW